MALAGQARERLEASGMSSRDARCARSVCSISFNLARGTPALRTNVGRMERAGAAVTGKREVTSWGGAEGEAAYVTVDERTRSPSEKVTSERWMVWVVWAARGGSGSVRGVGVPSALR